MFHRRSVLSRDAETMWRLSVLKATERTSFVWPVKVLVVRPVDRSHRRRVESQELHHAARQKRHMPRTTYIEPDRARSRCHNILSQFS